MPRRKFPSDHRPWFRVLDDILTDPKLNELDLADQMVFIRILALLNHRDSTDGILHVTDHAGYLITRRKSRGYWLKPLRKLDGTGLLCGKFDQEPVEIIVPKWARIQGFAPADSVSIPSLREEESRVDKNPPISPPLRASRESTPKPAAKAKGPTAFPPDGLSVEQKRALFDSKSLAGMKLPPAAFRHAETIVRAWAEGGNKRRTNWVSVMRGAIARGWALEGFVNGPGAPDRRGNGRVRRESNYTAPVTSPGWEPGGEMDQAFTRQQAEKH